MSIFSTFCQNISDILTFRSADSLLFKYLRINQNKGGKHRFIIRRVDHWPGFKDQRATQTHVYPSHPSLLLFYFFTSTLTTLWLIRSSVYIHVSLANGKKVYRLGHNMYFLFLNEGNNFGGQLFKVCFLTWSWKQLQGSGHCILQSQARKVQQRHSEKQWELYSQTNPSEGT